ncbi:MAG: NADPH:quinone reductase-like Zn-dependent oxidoreductase [Gammaproteobacteria bacterium]|jgi:NADPH:quinone reductase-like Zn-dependent oxidoreductase
MKAVRIHTYGNSDVLKYEDAHLARLASHDVLIPVVATSVNPVASRIYEGQKPRLFNLINQRGKPWKQSFIVSERYQDMGKRREQDAAFSFFMARRLS